jgi:hypothetical protein
LTNTKTPASIEAATEGENMTEQPTLFAEPTARRSDPKTSHKAAASARMRAGSHRHQLLAAFTNPAAIDTGRTSWEVGHASGLASKPGCSYWTRVSELARAGLIQFTGENRTVETGEEQRCYRITAAGLAALREMDG